ncbi:OmpP1/FadL family transporter [Flavobacterium sp. AJR]|uniref:OmpP1/FadL family transporter n=1 Tax=Flavobacterium sp. AJR TaxID=1979369 RepID=UPI000A3D64EE|nr:aromatic hydrocarbon degradation protein [Flavobacterium sp. AJR]OUL62710.1 aromatic hydrocarbon degradation protein [Flavobacterium sp. AJR]
MKNKIAFASLLVLMSLTSFSQSISSSPYSLYGLGSLYDSDFGPIPSIGSSGIALPSNEFINNLNPASLGFMYQNHFLFDVGGKFIETTYQNNSKSENRNNAQFSHIAFAFPVTQKSAFSVALRPYSSGAFKISNLKIPIENSQDKYNLDVTGTGGLNNFDFSYAYKINKKLSLGLSAAVLFGSTTDDRYYTVMNSITNINKKTNYNGLRPTLGVQYQIDSTLTIGSTFKSPSRIKASKVQSVTIVGDSGTITTDSDTASDVDDFYLPTEIGVGVSKVFKNNLTMSFDYEKSLWNDTKQSELYGDFVNQDRFAFGVSYKSKKNARKYVDRIGYGTGINYDTGYLEVDNQRVKNVSFSLGLTLPLESNSFSTLNISYSYGQKGKIGDGLIKENYHKISLNLSLDGLWFVKRKID